MSNGMQKAFYEQQLEANGKEGLWVIRFSSPWIESYKVLLDGKQAVINYIYTDATSMKYEGVERLSFGRENGKLLVINAVMETEMDKLSGN